jgi:hypothetical protein
MQKSDNLKKKLKQLIDQLTNQETIELQNDITQFIQIIENHQTLKKNTTIRDEYKYDKETKPQYFICRKTNRLENQQNDDKITSINEILYNYLHKYNFKQIDNIRKKANNFYLLYEETDINMIVQSLNNVFDDIVIISKENINSSYFWFHIRFNEQKKLHSKHNKLKVNGKSPILIFTKMRTNKMNQIFKIDRKKEPSCSQLRYSWINCRSVPIRKLTSKDETFQNEANNLTDIKFHDELLKLFQNHSNLSVDRICKAFLIELKKIRISFFNEILCNYIFIDAVVTNNLVNSSNIRIVGVDHRFKEEILGEELFFRPDFVCIYEDSLIIIEFKYRLDRRNQKFDSLNCLMFKQYGPRTLNYLKKNDSKVYNYIKKVVYIGFSYSNSTRNTCGMMYELYNIKDIDCDSYKTKEFIDAMKMYRRRFKRIKRNDYNN